MDIYAHPWFNPQTGDLLPELKKRLADSNKNLTTQALCVLGRIARAMGKAIDRNGRPLLAPAVKNITDQKQTVGGRGSREAAFVRSDCTAS